MFQLTYVIFTNSLYRYHAHLSEDARLSIRPVLLTVLSLIHIFFGKHNMQNISAAHKICEYLDIDTKDFCEAMMSFRSANKRLEKLYENKNLVVFRDFAHAPSKVRATIDAVREHYPDRQLISVFAVSYTHLDVYKRQG